MENSTVHNDQVTGLDAEDLFVQTDQSAAGFNIDQFHLVMPVVVAVRASFFQGIIYFDCGSNWHGKRLLFSEIFYL